MKCPYCNHDETKVSDSRESKDQTTIKRRRECSNCGKRFSTLEKVLKLDLEVIKSNQEIENFNLTKIRRSLLKCCEKRPVTLEQIEILLNNILNDLKKVDEAQIPTSTVGTIVLKNLKDFDDMAFLQYAIVHNNYKDMNQFVKELSKLKKFNDIEYKIKKK